MFNVSKNGKRPSAPVSQSFSGILAADRGRSANSRGESQENRSDEGPIVLSSLEFQKRSVPTDYLDSGQFLCVINKSQPTRIANRIQRIMDRTVSQEQAAGEKSSLKLKEAVHSAYIGRQRDWFNLTWQTPMIV